MNVPNRRTLAELKSSHLTKGLFREGECTPAVARKLLALMASPGRLEKYEFETNVYILNFDFVNQSVQLDDDLDPTPEGTLLLTMDETRALLEDYLGQRD